LRFAAKLILKSATQDSKISCVSRQLHSPLCAFLQPYYSHYLVLLLIHTNYSNGIRLTYAEPNITKDEVLDFVDCLLTILFANNRHGFASVTVIDRFEFDRSHWI
jgi:hypothetical protein